MGKCVIISREGGDFSMDLIFAGLVRRFGKDNVIDYPPREKHRQGNPRLLYTGDHEHDYGAARRSLCFVEGCEDMRRWDRRSIIKDVVSAGDVDWVFLDETSESYEKWVELFMLSPGTFPTVVVAGHDSFRAGNMDLLKERYGQHLRHIFADNWRDEWSVLDYVSPTNISCNFDHLWDVERRDEWLADKKYDICFFGYNSHPDRKRVIDHVREKWGHLNNRIVFEERPNQFDMFVRQDEMYRDMAQSKICLNLRGAAQSGWALRYYEIPYIGSFMLSQEFPGLKKHLNNGMRTEYFSDTIRLDSLIELSLSLEKGREQVASDCHEDCMKNHTIDARMDYIFEVLDGQG